MPNRARLKYPGTTAGDMIGPVVMPELANCWRETFKDKKKIFGSARIAVGGKGPDDPVDVVKAKREDSTLEPVFFHSNGEQLHEELLHSIAVNFNSVSGIVDFTPGDGNLAHLAVVHKMPYLGFCFTEQHADGLQKHLTRLVWADMQKEDSPLYQSGLVGILEGLAEDGEEQEEGKEDTAKANQPKEKAKAKAKKKGKAKGKGKAAAKADPALSKALKKKINKHKKDAEDDLDDEEAATDEEEPEDSESE